MLYNENINEENDDEILTNGLTKNSESFFSTSNTFNTENTHTQGEDDEEDDDEETDYNGIIKTTNSLTVVSFKSVLRQSMLKYSWDFYKLICSLLRDWQKNDEAFRLTITNDPLYPY